MGFSTAVRLWCLHETLKIALSGDVALGAAALHWRVSCAVLVVAAAAFPTSTLVVCAALIVRLADMIVRLPNIWDSCWWCLQTDASLLLLVLSARWRGVPPFAQWWAETTRLQLAVFYFFSSFWKLNSSFLDVRTSCAPIFVLTLSASLGLAPPTTLAPFVARTAPAVTIIGEEQTERVG